MAKDTSKTAHAPSCPATRYSIGTSEFVGRCNPRAQLNLQGCSTPVSKGSKVDGKGLTGKPNSFLECGKGYRYQEPVTWSMWQQAVDNGEQDKASRLYRILKGQENRPVHQNRSTELSMSMGEMLASKGIEVSL